MRVEDDEIFRLIAGYRKFKMDFLGINMQDLDRNYLRIPLIPLLDYYRASYFGHVLRMPDSSITRQALLGVFLVDVGKETGLGRGFT